MIRTACSDDIPMLLAMVEKNLDTLLPRSPENYQELLNSTFIAEENEVIAGSCVLEVYSPKIAEIRTLVVAEEYRGRGIGRQLVESAVAEAKRRNIYEVMVVTSNVPFFQSLNFGACLNEKYALFLNGK
jgi:amino-acid N-acetyltransferase